MGCLHNLIETNNPDDDESNDEDCIDAPLIEVSKTVDPATNPVLNADDSWTVTYTITATNSGAGVGTYDLFESIQPGTGISVSTTTLPTIAYGGDADGQQGTETSPFAAVSTDPGTLVVSGEMLAAGGSES